MEPFPLLTTKNLLIREFRLQDLEQIHHILDIELANDTTTLPERKKWLQWTVSGYRENQKLCQPPYGERAIVLKKSGDLIGAIGLVPCLAPFHQVFHEKPDSLYTTECGLFYAISPKWQKKSFATESANAMVKYAFHHLHLARIVATTTYDNVASQKVMQKLGMKMYKNKHSTPEWMQIVGLLEHTSRK